VRTVLVVKGRKDPQPIHNFSKQNQFEGVVKKMLKKDKTNIERRHREGKETEMKASEQETELPILNFLQKKIYINTEERACFTANYVTVI
jgi:hypothetical protein